MGRFFQLIIILFIIQNVNCAWAKQLKKIKVQLGKKILTVEVADNDKTRERGLMERMTLASDTGMLFIFPDEGPRYFWMKNTYIPLSIGFFNKQKTLVEIQHMKPMGSPMEAEIPRYQSRSPAKYALEVNQGWFKKNKINLKDQIKFLEPLSKNKK